jgi:SHS2 domain-containing protein
MNPRIQLLAEQAKKYALDAMIKITDREQALKVYSETYDTKFAQLIVQECIHVAYNKMAIQKMDGIRPSVVCDAIKEHFGVEL